MDAELVGYLDERFAVVDQRFATIDRRFDAVDQRFEAMGRRQDTTDARLEDTRRHLGILIENLDTKIQMVSEGVINVDRKIDRVREELKTEIGEVKSLLRVSYTNLDRRVRRLETDRG